MFAFPFIGTFSPSLSVWNVGFKISLLLEYSLGAFWRLLELHHVGRDNPKKRRKQVEQVPEMLPDFNRPTKRNGGD